MGKMKIQIIKQFGTLKPKWGFPKTRIDCSAFRVQHRQLLCWTDAVLSVTGIGQASRAISESVWCYARPQWVKIPHHCHESCNFFFCALSPADSMYPLLGRGMFLTSSCWKICFSVSIFFVCFENEIENRNLIVLVLKQEYFGVTRSGISLGMHPANERLRSLAGPIPTLIPARLIPWLLMPWLLTSPGHQQPWYWICSVNVALSSTRQDFNCMFHLSVEK